METKIDLSGNILITKAETIKKICKPLYQVLDIPSFCYCKIYNDGSRIVLCSLPKVIQFFYEEGHFINTWFFSGAPASDYNPGKISWAVEHNSMTEGQSVLVKELKNHFNLSEGVEYVEKTADFVEVYGFGTNKPHIYKVSDYTFKHFIFAFKEQARKIIEGAEREKIRAPIFSKPLLIQELKTNEEKFIKEININRYYLGGAYTGTHLTDREVECLNWCVRGKTAEEISILLSISNRTIERHLANVMRKLNCNKQSQLIRKAIELGIAVN